MIRDIVKKGMPVLARKAEIINFETEYDELKHIAADIIDTMNELLSKHEFNKGIGLAAPQIGYSKRIFGHAPPRGTITIYVNPELIEKSDKIDFQYEGCLSFFDVRGRVERSLDIKLKYFDLENNCREDWFSAGNARIIQHEIDHLNGILYCDRMTNTDSVIPYADYIKMKESAWQY